MCAHTQQETPVVDSSVPRDVLLTGEYCGVPPSLVWYVRTHPTRGFRSGLLCIKWKIFIVIIHEQQQKSVTIFQKQGLIMDYSASDIKDLKFGIWLNNKLNCPLQSISLNKNLKLNSLVHIDISPGISFSYILCIVISYLSKFDEHSSPLLLLGNRQITIIL